MNPSNQQVQIPEDPFLGPKQLPKTFKSCRTRLIKIIFWDQYLK